MPTRPRAPKVALVLGGGGVLGAAWLLGALGALERQASWDPARSSLLLGTSAGSLVAALVAARTSPWRFAEAGHEADLQGLLAAADFHIPRPQRLLHWGSWRMVLEGWRGGGDSALRQIWSGLLPAGLVSTSPIEHLVSSRLPQWPTSPRLWAVAADYQTGSRVVLKGPGHHSITPAQAVAASCAIPGFYRPVPLGPRTYVDGGVVSSTSLGLLAGQGYDLAVCLLPLSPATAIARRTPFTHLRRLAHSSLHRQMREVEASGTPVLLIEPEGAAADLIGLNFMNRSRAQEVAHAAQATVIHRLGQPHARSLLPLLHPA